MKLTKSEFKKLNSLLKAKESRYLLTKDGIDVISNREEEISYMKYTAELLAKYNKDGKNYGIDLYTGDLVAR